MGSICPACQSQVTDSTEITVQESQDLRSEALRIFHLADKDSDGQLDLSELNTVGGFDEGSKVLIEQMDLDVSGKVDEKEWLKYIEKLAKMNQGMAASILELYEKQIADSAFPLKEEALRVFRKADKDSDGLLDLFEMENMRGRADWAQGLMNNVDKDKNGKVNQSEWLAYVKALQRRKPHGRKRMRSACNAAVEGNVRLFVGGEACCLAVRTGQLACGSERPPF